MAGKRSELSWRLRLTGRQYFVLRQKGTEQRGTGKYDKHIEEGVYACVACKAPLYKSDSKFSSGCGWPAFFDAIPGAVISRKDDDGYRREIICANCEGHLGHVFKGEGFNTPTDERHCVNSICLNFNKADIPEDS